MKIRCCLVVVPLAAAACTETVSAPSSHDLAVLPEMRSELTPYNYESDYVIYYWRASDSVKRSYPDYVRLPGSYETTIHALPPGFIKGKWPGDLYRWVSDTLLQFRFDRLQFGSDEPGCTYSATKYVTTAVNTVKNGCNATWLRTVYDVVVHAIWSPFSASVTGPTDIKYPGTYTWNAGASGGSLLYFYSWSKSVDGGFSFYSIPCGTTSQCSLTIAAGDTHPLRIRATVRSPDPPSQCCGNTRLDPTVSVAVDAQVSPVVGIDGPTNLKTGAVCTWTADVQGGDPPYTYLWSGALSGTQNYVTGKVSSSKYLYVRVTDEDGRVGNADIWITVDDYATEMCG